MDFERIYAQPQSLIVDHRGLKLQKKTSEHVSRKRLLTVMERKSVI